MTIRTPWTGQQRAIVKRHWELPEAELKALVDAAGPPRSVSAINEFRRKLGLLKDRPSAKAAWRQSQAVIARAAERERMNGWPAMRGTQEERERRYIRLLFEGLREEARRMAARDGQAA